MVILIKKFHHKSQLKIDPSESIALQSFNSSVSENMHKLFSGRKNGSNCASLSLSWYLPCFNFMQGMNRAFAKLVNDLDYPVSQWKGDLVEDYLSHTLNMLDALNSLTSLLSHLGISRLSLSHALSLIPSCPSSAIPHLKPIILKKNEKGLIFEEFRAKSFSCGKEKAIYEAMIKMRNVDTMIMKVLMSGLCGESETNGDLSLVVSKGFSLGFGENSRVIKEIEDVNEAVNKFVACLVSGEKCGAVDELKRNLSQLQNLTEKVVKQVNAFFSEVLAKRNELIDYFRLFKCT